MKKTALALSVFLSLLGTCLTGCNDVKKEKIDHKEVIFKVGETTITADDIFGFISDDTAAIDYNFLKTDEGVEAVYGAIYKALAQKNATVTQTMEASVDEKIEDFESEVKSYASENGVTERNARKVKLEEKGFEDLDELRASYLIEEQKAFIEEKFDENYLEPVTSTDTNTLQQNWVKETAPMVVRHILVEVADSSSIYTLAKVTENEVDKSVSVLKRLALGKDSRNSFKNVAYDMSADSNEKGGNVGIVDTYTSFVNEFKLGLYVHTVKEGGDNYDPECKLIPQDVKDEIFAAGGVYETVDTINVATVAAVYDYVREDQAKDEQVAAGHTKISEYDEDLYPRNVIYNKYFNSPAIKYLVCDFTNAEADIKAIVKECYPHADDAKVAEIASKIMATDGYYDTLFKAKENIQTVSATDGRIADDKGSAIILAKSQYGMHFITSTYNSLDHDDASKYFSTTSVADNSGYYKGSDYDFGYTSSTAARSNRKTEVKNRVKNYVKGGFGTISPDDTLYTFEVYEKYLEITDSISVKENLKTAVEEFITQQKNIKEDTIATSLNETWESYVDSIKAVNEQHSNLY